MQGVADGVFLGIAGDRTLDRLDQEYYLDTNYYRTDAYNDRGLFDWESDAIRTHFPPAGHIVVLGAGAGREIVALERHGYEVIGYEPNEALVRFGNEFLARARVTSELRPDDSQPLAGCSGPGDAVVVGWGVYHSIRSRDERIGLLRQIRCAADEGAPILLSYFTRRGETFYQRTLLFVAGPLRRLRRRPAPEAGDVITPFFAHMFTEAEIAAELNEAGLRLVAHGDDGYGWAVAVVCPARPLGEGVHVNADDHVVLQASPGSNRMA